MLYKYRVTLAGIKGFYRVYEMGVRLPFMNSTSRCARTWNFRRIN